MILQQLTAAETDLAAGRIDEALQRGMAALAAGDTSGRGLLVLAECLLARPDITLNGPDGAPVDALGLLLDAPPPTAAAADRRRQLLHWAITRAGPGLARLPAATLLDAVSASLMPPEDYLPALDAVARRDAGWAGLADRAARAAAGGADSLACTAADIDTVARQAPLLAYWRLRANADLATELILRGVRRGLLDHVAAGDGIGPAWIDLAATLALQGHLNEHVWAVDTAEAARLDALPGEAWLTRAMYGDVEGRAVPPIFRTVPSPALRDLLAVVADGPARRRAAAAVIGAIAIGDDAATASVRDFYEATPYPRWRHGFALAPAIPYAQWLAGRLPGVPAPPFAQGGDFDLLVAGCGTGQALICPAQYRGARITAVDLSQASLAYAWARMQECGCTDIAFHHGDLRHVADLGRRFDVIECTGVVHHMDDPWSGVAALAAVLRPGGHLLLSVYSRHYRALLAPATRAAHAAADRAAAEGGGPQAQVRAARAALIAGRRDIPGIEQVLATRDFYVTSDCRDLLLHPVERLMTIDELVAGAVGHGLRPLGLIFAHPAWRMRAAEHRAMLGLPDGPAAWAAFEAAEPAAFANMINLLFERTA